MRPVLPVLLLVSACSVAPPFSIDEVSPAEVRSDVGGTLRLRGRFPPLLRVDFEHPDASTRNAAFEVQVQQGRTIQLLEEVVSVDATTLTAAVLPGLAPGPWALEVTDPRGRRSRIEAAFTVRDCSNPLSCPGSCAENNGGCSIDALCLDMGTGRACTCNPGYAGDGVTCEDVDECATNNGGCSVSATCFNLPGKRVCVCQPGFEGDGVTCVDIDECATSNGGCSLNATCTNLPGGSVCGCNPGFMGDGFTCDDVDECDAGVSGCSMNATCTNSPGSFACVCGAGYMGDGGLCQWSDASLAGLVVAPGPLTFNPSVSTYSLTVPAGTTSLSVTPTVVNPAGVVITVNGVVAASGAARAVPLPTLPATIEVRVRPQVGLTSSWYVLVSGPTSQATYAKDVSSSAGDRLGVPLAVSADGSTMAVGAPGEDGAGSGIDPPVNEAAANSGAVIVLVRSGSVWVPQARIKASNTESGDGFGSAVALSASGDTLVVGAPSEDSSASGVGGNQINNGEPASGAVYVFVRTGGVWAQQAYMKASNANAGDAFGSAVAVSSDGNIVAVGAPGEASKAVGVNGNQGDNTAPGSGAVYVFQRAAGIWSADAYLKASNTDSGDAFGASLALSGSGTALIVGAPGEDSNATGINGADMNNAALGSGAAFTFARAAGWSQTAYLKASNTDPGDAFGASVAISANATLVAVGAPAEASNGTGTSGNPTNNGAVGSGAVYLFGASSNPAWFQRTYVKASNTGSGDGFGTSIALSADGAVLAVGAPGEDSSATGVGGNQQDNGASNSGAVYVLLRRFSSVVQQAWLKASNTDAFDEFGAAVALSSDGSVLASGAPGEAGAPGAPASNTAPNSGAAYVFTR